MKVGLDFDGVVGDCGQLKSDVAKELYDVNIPPGSFKKELVVGKFLSMEQYYNLQKTIYYDKVIGFKMKQVKGAFQFITKLIQVGHEVVVITARDGDGLAIAKEWSSMRNVEMRFIGVGYGKSKAEAAVAEKIDIYVDDDLDKLEPLIGIVSHLFLFSWEYNKHIMVPESIMRIASWKGLFYYIQVLT